MLLLDCPSEECLRSMFCILRGQCWHKSHANPRPGVCAGSHSRRHTLLVNQGEKQELHTNLIDGSNTGFALHVRSEYRLYLPSSYLDRST